MDWRLGYGTMGLIALTLCGGLLWYEAAEAPADIPASIALYPPPVLDPYPELAGLRVAVNTASEEELMELPGIGTVRAKAIRSYIRTNGKISRASQLLDIDGIGEDTLDRIKPYLVFH